VLYNFKTNGTDGAYPSAGLIFDALGNLYGTTSGGGTYGLGTVFKLTPGSSGWVHTSLYDFTGGNDGAYPYGTVILDAGGNIYSTASQAGAYGRGVVFGITP
jgi:uncharacterized repeat protein (TIGR03803 family)